MAAGGAMVAEKASQLMAAGGVMAGRVQEGASQAMAAGEAMAERMQEGASQLAAGLTRLISGERQPGGGEAEGEEGEQLVSMKGGLPAAAAEGEMQEVVQPQPHLGGGGPDLEVAAAAEVALRQQEGGGDEGGGNVTGLQLAGLPEGEQPPQWTMEARGDCA